MTIVKNLCVKTKSDLETTLESLSNWLSYKNFCCSQFRNNNYNNTGGWKNPLMKNNRREWKKQDGRNFELI